MPTPGIVNLVDYATGGGVVDDTDAIDAALDVTAAIGGVLLVPPGRFKTNGGHVIPSGVTVVGAREGNGSDGVSAGTVFLNRGATYCFRLIDEVSGGTGAALKNVTIMGNTASLTAVAGGIGVEISNGQGHSLDGVFIYGFTDSGIGLRFRNASGTVEYVEHASVKNCSIVNCARLIQFTSDSGAGQSFGYNQLDDVQLQVYASQIGIDVGGSGAVEALLYNSRIIGQLHYTGNNGVGIDVTENGAVWQGTYIDLVGEMLGAYTGCLRIRNVNDFRAYGRFFVANPGTIADSVGSADTHSFYEVKLDANHNAYPVLPRVDQVWDIPNTANGATATTSVTVPGAVLGDPVSVGISTGLSAGVVLTAQVDGTDSVQVLLLNQAGFSIDPPSATLSVIVHKR